MIRNGINFKWISKRKLSSPRGRVFGQKIEKKPWRVVNSSSKSSQKTSIFKLYIHTVMISFAKLFTRRFIRWPQEAMTSPNFCVSTPWDLGKGAEFEEVPLCFIWKKKLQKYPLKAISLSQPITLTFTQAHQINPHSNDDNHSLSIVRILVQFIKKIYETWIRQDSSRKPSGQGTVLLSHP